MTTINVQFSDSAETVIIATFSCPQDPKTWANTGTVNSSDARWLAYYNSFAEWLRYMLPSPTDAAPES